MARPMKRVPFGRWLMAMALVEAWFVSSREWAGTHLFRKVVGIAHLVECGPGKVLAGMTKRIEGSLQGFAVTDPASLAQTMEALK